MNITILEQLRSLREDTWEKPREKWWRWALCFTIAFLAEYGGNDDDAGNDCQPPSFLCTDNPCSNPSPAPRLGPHLIHRAAESSPMVFSQEPSLPPRASNNKLAAKLFASSTEQPKVSGTSCLHLFLQRRQPVMIFSKELFPKWVSGQRSFSECK